jgi:hypothetical protein
MLGPHRWSIEREHAATLEDPIDDSMCQILIVEHTAPAGERLVGREDHRTLLPMTIIDDVEEHVRRVGAVREIAHLVAD